MQYNSKVFFVAVLVIIICISYLSYKKYIVDRDYSLYIQVDCEPATESCFMGRCDPSGTDCTGDPNVDAWYYKEVTKHANVAMDCDHLSDDCASAECQLNEPDCTVQYCDPTDESLECSTPPTEILIEDDTKENSDASSSTDQVEE